MFTEHVREALAHLYDPPELSASPLAAELVRRGALRSAGGLYALLLAAIEELRPPEGAPRQSHGWRCYRYLRLRYVDCIAHEAIAQDLQISVRHAARVHQEALQALSVRLLVGISEPAMPTRPPLHTLSSAPDRHARQQTSLPYPPPESGSSLEAELAILGRQPPDSGVEVHAIARSVCGTLERLAAAQGVELRLEIPHRLSPVRMNRVALRQVLLNLVLYVIQLARGVVSVWAEERDDTVVVGLTCREVETPGTCPDALRPAAESDSLLMAAKLLARLQHARVEEVGDTRPPASLFLHLPIGAMRTVLVVDDNPDIGDLFRRMLAKRDYKVIHARTAARALRLARDVRPDVIILDVVMPARDGWEIYAALQSGPETADIPVIVCSVLPDRGLALSLGAAGFLAKPVTRRTLVESLDRVLGG